MLIFPAFLASLPSLGLRPRFFGPPSAAASAAATAAPWAPDSTLCAASCTSAGLRSMPAAARDSALFTSVGLNRWPRTRVFSFTTSSTVQGDCSPRCCGSSAWSLASAMLQQSVGRGGKAKAREARYTRAMRRLTRGRGRCDRRYARLPGELDNQNIRRSRTWSDRFWGDIRGGIPLEYLPLYHFDGSP